MEKLKHFVFAVFFIALSHTAQAQTNYFQVNGISYYTIDTVPYTVGVSIYCSNIEDYFPDGVVTIPESVTYGGISYTVTTIRRITLYENTCLTSINIPNSVTTIDDFAFYLCESLTSINIVPDNPRYKSIDGVVFNHAADTLITCPEGKQGAYFIPNSVTAINRSAFSRCGSLTSINIPNSVTSIGENAFEACTSLASINIPNSVTTIGNRTFYFCPGLTSIIIPNSVITIGELAFACCGLTTVNIPNSVTTIGEGAFGECKSLTSVTIGNSLTTTTTMCSPIGAVFGGCTSLESIHIAPDNPRLRSIDGVVFNLAADTLLLCPPGRHGEYSIPNSVTTIGRWAFYICSNLTSVNIPNSVTTIKDDALYGCWRLSSVTIGNSVTNIDYGAFNQCQNLNYVTVLGNTPPSLGSHCFTDIGGSHRLTVRCGCLNAYRNSDWNQWFNLIEESCDSHSITVVEATQPGGTVSTSLNEAYLGDEVEINITTAEGYAIKSILVFNVIDNTQTIPTYKKSETATTKTLAFTMPGYNIKVYADIRQSTSSINEQNNIITANIFPNPTNDIVTIEAENLQRICIFNTMGQKVLESFTSGNKFDCNIGSYSKGVYLLQIETTNGIVTRQIIVE